MPTYDYLCKVCGARFEHFQSMSSSPLKSHPECDLEGSEVVRIISGGSGLIFKGSGFYSTDYKNKSNPEKDSKENDSKKPAVDNKTNKKQIKEDSSK